MKDMKEILELLQEVQDEKLKKTLLFIFGDIKEELMSKPAGIKKHHTSVGGLYNHIKEVMNIALSLFDSEWANYNCSRDDVITASFVHDFNKLDIYVEAPEWKKIKYGQKFDIKKDLIRVNESAKTVSICSEYGLIMNDIVLNAITFHHGAWSVDASSPYGYIETKDFTPLAILLHSADLISSQILGTVKKEK